MSNIVLTKVTNFFQQWTETARPQLNDDMVNNLASTLMTVIQHDPKQGEEILKGLIKALNEKGEKDVMTGATNRAGFERLMAEFDMSPQHAKRNPTGRNFMAVIDLDGFKQINDVLGHEAGDEALKHTVLNLKKMVRDNDIVCRTGGDEFIVILQDATPEGATQKVESIRKEFATMSFDYDGIMVPIRATIAHGEINPDKKRMTKDILKEIDLAMLALKKEKGDTRYTGIDTIIAAQYMSGPSQGQSLAM